MWSGSSFAHVSVEYIAKDLGGEVSRFGGELPLECTMQDVEALQIEPKVNIIKVYSEFMSRIAQLEELVSTTSPLLSGFHQAIGILRRPSIAKTSRLVERIIKAHSSRRLLSYVEAGCVNSHDSVHNVSKLHSCHLGLKDHIDRAKVIVNELKGLLYDADSIVQNFWKKDETLNHDLDPVFASSDREQFTKPGVTDFAAMMAFLYAMVKQDYEMQVRIVSSLSYKSSSGELETYCQMWALRPFVDDGVMHKAWELVS